MRNEGSQVRPLRREFRRFFIVLCHCIPLLIARLGNWQVHGAGVGQLLQNAGADDDILAELDSLMAWASLVPITLVGLAFIGVFALFLAPIFHKFHDFGRIGGSPGYSPRPPPPPPPRHPPTATSPSPSSS